MSFCTNCGTQLPDGTKFCTSCGTKVAIGVPQEPPQKPQVRPSEDGRGLVIDAPAGSTVEISSDTSAPDTAGEFGGIVWDGDEAPAPQPAPQPQFQQPQFQQPQPQPQFQQQYQPQPQKNTFWATVWKYVKGIGITILIIAVLLIINKYFQ